MRAKESRPPTGRRKHNALIGWLFALVFVVLAMIGPPLTGQGIPSLIELRHDILMIDDEFERSFIRSEDSRRGSPLVQIDYLRPGDRASRLAREQVR
jgi:hypothetical protein